MLLLRKGRPHGRALPVAALGAAVKREAMNRPQWVATLQLLGWEPITDTFNAEGFQSWRNVSTQRYLNTCQSDIVEDEELYGAAAWPRRDWSQVSTRELVRVITYLRNDNETRRIG